MPTKIQEINYIKKTLSKIPDTWQLNNNSEKQIDSIFSFIIKLKEKNPNISLSHKLKPHEIPYNNSLLHFLLYYTYHPKYPFIIHKKNNLIIGSFTGRKYNNLEISFPLIKKASNIIDDLNWLLSIDSFKSILKKNNIKNILIRDIDDNFVKLLKKDEEIFNFKLKSLRELKYATYNVDRTLNLNGVKFANLRWHINSFKKRNHKIELVNLSDSVSEVIHLIGKWRKNAIEKRGFSYVNINSDKLGAKLFGRKTNYKNYQKKKKIVGPENIISRILRIDGKIASFNLGFPLGIFQKKDVFAHTIGIVDTSIPHLAEYAQYNFWKEIKNKGYNYVNDGPTWKNDLRTYKTKFRPIGKKRYYWATIVQRL